MPEQVLCQGRQVLPSPVLVVEAAEVQVRQLQEEHGGGAGRGQRGRGCGCGGACAEGGGEACGGGCRAALRTEEAPRAKHGWGGWVAGQGGGAGAEAEGGEEAGSVRWHGARGGGGGVEGRLLCMTLDDGWGGLDLSLRGKDAL